MYNYTTKNLNNKTKTTKTLTKNVQTTTAESSTFFWMDRNTHHVDQGDALL